MISFIGKNSLNKRIRKKECTCRCLFVVAGKNNFTEILSDYTERPSLFVNKSKFLIILVSIFKEYKKAFQSKANRPLVPDPMHRDRTGQPTNGASLFICTDGWRNTVQEIWCNGMWFFLSGRGEGSAA